MKPDLLWDIRKSQISIFFAGICMVLTVFSFVFYLIDRMGWQVWVLACVLMLTFALWTDRQYLMIKRNLAQKLYGEQE